MLLAQKEVFYRVTQEALHNVVKHANAARIDVRLVVDGDEAVLEVKDDGVGFDDSRSFPGHMGLVSMAERAAGIGGRLTISSVPNRGTLVRLAAVIRERVPSK
jgi:signal transduction histidine kinase